jgi:hypothetical protein
MGKSISNKTIALSEDQVVELCLIYHKKLDIISNIIVSFLEVTQLQNEKLVSFLNSNLNFRWIPYLLKQNLLFNFKDTFLNCVRNIVANITSPSELENQLVLPYSVILRSATEIVELLIQEQLFLPLASKIFDYAKLFVGTHLKITTLSVFAEIAFLKHEWIPKVMELYGTYGKIESNEWEDEDDEDEERVIDKFFNGIVNEEVERVFKYTFGELSWDSNLLESKIIRLKQMI